MICFNSQQIIVNYMNVRLEIHFLNNFKLNISISYILEVDNYLLILNLIIKLIYG